MAVHAIGGPRFPSAMRRRCRSQPELCMSPFVVEREPPIRNGNGIAPSMDKLAMLPRNQRLFSVKRPVKIVFQSLPVR
jgi:hypothetical protein